MWFKWTDWNAGTTWDRARQLGESGEYQMGRSGEVCCLVQSSKGGSFHLCRLRTNRLAPVSKFDYVLAHAGFMGSCKHSSFIGHWDGSYPTIPAVMYIGIVHGPPTDAHRGIAWRTCTRVRWAQIISLNVSWTVATCGVFMTLRCHVVRWLSLQGWKLLEPPWHSGTWVILACCSHSIVIQFHIVDYMDDVDYFVVMALW
jgi:hypothetical protein